MAPERKLTGLVIGGVFMKHQDLAGPWRSGHSNNARELKAPKVPPKVSKVSKVPPKVPKVLPKVSSYAAEASPDNLTKIRREYSSPVEAQVKAPRPLVSGYDSD